MSPTATAPAAAKAGPKSPSTAGGRRPRRRKPERTHDLLIIGAGFLGLGTAIKARDAGIDDLVILERGDSVGGTWRDAKFPGAACDIPSLLYSFSFAQNPGWTRAYSPSAEICAHIEDMAERSGLLPLIRFDTEVTGLRFDRHEGTWTVETSTGRQYRARSVVAAAGPLSDASFPEMRGIERYEGTKILSARWDTDFDPAGKNIAVIGTGASAIQIVPELVKTAASVKVFQRTPGWVIPRWDTEMPSWAQQLFARVPGSQQLAREALFLSHEVMATGLVWDTPVTSLIQQLGRLHLRLAVKDPWLRRQLTPDYRAGCKRMLVSSDYLPALQRPNCKLITWPIATITEDGLRTSDGVEHHVDAIVFATGYDVHHEGPPFSIEGSEGQVLNEVWQGRPQAYKSMSIHGFPNLFLTCGPNSGPGHNSLLYYAECQIEYAVAGVRAILDGDLRALDVRQDVQEKYNVAMQRRLRTTTWQTGCSSWYLTDDGFNAAMYPGFATQYRHQMRHFDLSDYDVSTHAAQRLWNASEVAG